MDEIAPEANDGGEEPDLPEEEKEEEEPPEEDDGLGIKEVVT